MCISLSIDEAHRYPVIAPHPIKNQYVGQSTSTKTSILTYQGVLENSSNIDIPLERVMLLKTGPSILYPVSG